MILDFSTSRNDRGLVNVIEACVWTESLRDLDPVTLLVVLEKGCDHARKRERAAVKSVGQLGLAISVLISEFQTIRLV